LLIYGTQDLQVRKTEGELLAQAQPQAELFVVDGMNHVLKCVPANRKENLASYENPELPIAAELVEGIQAFLSQQIRGAFNGNARDM
jgi:hypothetical protein